MHGRSEIAGANTGLETRTAVGHEVPVPADDGWSPEESKRLIENSRDNARIPSSGEERDRKASQVRSSEGMSTELVGRGRTSPIDIRGVLNVIPDFTRVPNPVPQRLPDIHSLFDGVTSGRASSERRRDDLEGQGPNLRTETPNGRSRAQSEVRRSPETVEGTPSKRIRSSSVVSSVSPSAEAGLRQVSALLGSPESVTQNRPRVRGAGMAVGDVQMSENSSGGRSPMDRDIPTFEIGTPAPQGRDICTVENESSSRTIEKLRGDVNGMMREIDDLKVLANRSEKRQVLIDAFHEELDKLQMQIAGVSSEVLSKETIVDISSAVVQSYDLSQIESNKNRDEEVERIMDAFEKVKAETRECMDRVREEIQDSVDAGTAEITARTNKIIEGESETRRKSFKKVDETLGATVSRVDGLQESIIRCRNELNGVKTMIADFRKHYDDCVPKEEYRKGLVSTEKALESIRTRVKDLEVRTTLRSDNVPSALRSTDEEKQRVLIRREIDEISSAIRAMSQRLGDNDERTTKGIGENKESVERLRSAMRKVVEIVNSERQGNKELAQKVERNEKAAVDTEIAFNRRFEKVSAEIVELRRDFVEASSGSRTMGDGKRLFCPSSPRPTRLTILSFSLAFSVARSDIAISTLLTSRSAALMSSRSSMFSLSRVSILSVSLLVSSRVFPVDAETSSTFCLMPSSLSLHPLGSTLDDRLRIFPRVPSRDILQSVFRLLISPLISAI